MRPLSTTPRPFTKEKPVAVYFSKRVSQAVAPEGDIERHAGLVERLDYEVELGVILGKAARNVKAEEAGDYIFGYTVINDVSARDVQTSHKQWYFGKSLDGFTPWVPASSPLTRLPSPRRWTSPPPSTASPGSTPTPGSSSPASPPFWRSSPPG